MLKGYGFQFISHSILVLFLGIMVYVICIAYTRQSGSTGLNMSTIQKLRYDHNSKTYPVSPSS